MGPPTIARSDRSHPRFPVDSSVYQFPCILLMETYVVWLGWGHPVGHDITPTWRRYIFKK